MTFFKSFSKNNSCKSANKFATPHFCAENTEKSNMVDFCADTAVAVSVLFFVIICLALISPGFLIVSVIAMVINSCFKNISVQNAALPIGQ